MKALNDVAAEEVEEETFELPETEAATTSLGSCSKTLSFDVTMKRCIRIVPYFVLQQFRHVLVHSNKKQVCSRPVFCYFHTLFTERSYSIHTSLLLCKQFKSESF